MRALRGMRGKGRMKGNEPIFEWTFLPSMDDAMTSGSNGDPERDLKMNFQL